jgi:hypothetical protein
MSLQEIVVMIHNGEYGRAISSMEMDVKDTTKPASERLEYCKWLAECNRRLGDEEESGNWYLEAVKVILSMPGDQKLKAKEAMPLAQGAMESYEKGGDAADVLVAARLKQYLVGLSK